MRSTIPRYVGLLLLLAVISGLVPIVVFMVHVQKTAHVQDYGYLAALVLADLALLFAGLSYARRRLVEPLARIHDATSRFRTGELSHRIELPEQQELSELADAFNRMAAELERSLTLTRASEERYHDLVDNLDAIVWELDAETFAFTFVSRWAETLLGYPVSRWSEADFFASVLHPDDRQRVLETCARESAAGRDHEAEFRVLTADGRVLWLRETVRVIPARGERPPHLHGIFIDITQRRQAEEALRLSEERHRTLLQSLPQRIFFKDPGSVFVTVNEVFARELGRRPEELIGKSDYDLFPPELAKKYRHDDQRILALRQPEVLEEVNVVDGRRRIVEVVKAPVIGDDGEIQGLLGMFTDITERKETEEALRTSERRLRQQNLAFGNLALSHLLDQGDFAAALEAVTETAVRTVEVSRAGIWLFTEDRTVLRCADLYDPATGEHTSGHELLVAAYPAYFAAIRRHRALAAHDARNDPRTREFNATYFVPEGVTSTLDATIRLRGREAGVVCLEHSGAPRQWSLEEESFAGSLADMVRLALEARERRAAEEKLHEFADQLLRSNQELEEFAYVASHDLQEPLRKIQAFGERLEADYCDRLEDQGRDYLARMQGAAGRMQLLIQDLLTFSRVSTQTRPFERVDLNEIVHGVLSDLEVQLEQSGGGVRVDRLPVIQGDAFQMRQLFQNLLSNALKFRGAAPPLVRIEGARTEPGEGERDIQTWEIRVSDNGIGFDEKYLDRIFNPFQRLHGRSEYPGTGIGLAICRKIAVRHGGSITARSAPGAGSTFVVTLPAEREFEPRSTAGELAASESA